MRVGRIVLGVYPVRRKGDGHQSVWIERQDIRGTLMGCRMDRAQNQNVFHVYRDLFEGNKNRVDSGAGETRVEMESVSDLDFDDV